MQPGVPTQSGAQDFGGSNKRGNPWRGLTELAPTKCCCPVRKPDWLKRGVDLILAAAVTRLRPMDN